MPKKQVPIKYTSREFASIKTDLVDYVKRYYPQVYRDFNEASFGSLMLDTVSYVGDILSFYLDYQANESFLHTAVEYDNIIKLGRQLGYRYKGVESSWGTATFYIQVPANSTGLGPDTRYMPILKKGSQFSAEDGGAFILNEDIDFAHPENEIRVASVQDSTGIPVSYAIKTQGTVCSGVYREEIHPVGDFKSWQKIGLTSDNITEIMSVVDTEGHEYFQVDYLSQDVVWKPVTNRDSDTKDQAAAILKPFTVPRRFIVDRQFYSTTLVFGSSSEMLDPNTRVTDPSNVVMKVHGKNYISDEAFDPSRLITSDKFGVGPSKTDLKVVYRVNSGANVNAQPHSLTTVTDARFEFDDPTVLTIQNQLFVRGSLEVDNEEAIIGDVTAPHSSEIKRKIYDVFATQNRAVTQQDYEAMVYQMPKEYGAIKRCKVLRDHDSLKRNLNLYVISERRNTTLVNSNDIVKRNVKSWILKNKMINDTVDILDAKIVNIGLDFVVVGAADVPKYDTLQRCQAALQKLYERKLEIGEKFYISDIYTKLNRVEGVVDVSKVSVFQKTGGRYSDIRFDLEKSMSADGRYINVPENVVMEIKFPTEDIKGVIS
jgi:hypothetical protein